MYEFIEMFMQLDFAKVIFSFLDNFARWIGYDNTGTVAYDLTDNQVGFIAVLCTALFWLFLVVIFAYFFIKIVISIVEGVLNW